MPPSRRLRLPEDVAQLVRSLHPDLKRKIRAGFGKILDDPHAGKALRDDLEGLRSLRIGRFRIIYRMSSRNVIEVLTVGPRRTVYEETLRRLKREMPERE